MATENFLLHFYFSNVCASQSCIYTCNPIDTALYSHNFRFAIGCALCGEQERAADAKVMQNLSRLTDMHILETGGKGGKNE